MVRLRDVGLSKSYRRSLREAGREMLQRLHRRGFAVTAKTPAPTLDRWLETIVEEARVCGERLYKLTLGVLALQRALNISGHLLRGTWRAIQGWRSLAPVRSRTPITAFCLEGVVLKSLLEGWQEEGWQRLLFWSSSLALWLGFAALLRPGEVLKLRVGDVSFSTGGGRGSVDPGFVLVVQSPKTKRIWHKQFVLRKDERLERWLRWWVQDTPRTWLLFPLTRYVWNKHFGIVLQNLGLGHCNYTLGSLRVGGATHLFRKNSNLGELQFLGRWASSNTLQFYLQGAFAAFVEAQHSHSSDELLTVLHDRIHLLNQPPRSSLRHLVGSAAHASARRVGPNSRRAG